MNPKNITAIVVSALVVVGAVAYVISKPSVTEPGLTTQPDTSTQTNTNSQTTKSDSFTAVQVATHNNKTDCWTIINGNVYDITSYVPRHPGGDDILAACGADGTSLFTQRTTEEGESVGSGTPHSQSASSQLASFKVGELSE